MDGCEWDPWYDKLWASMVLVYWLLNHGVHQSKYPHYDVAGRMLVEHCNMHLYKGGWGIVMSAPIGSSNRKIFPCQGCYISAIQYLLLEHMTSLAQNSSEIQYQTAKGTICTVWHRTHGIPYTCGYH